jgi:hypothetical protein
VRTGFHIDRLGFGEWLNALASIALAVLLLAGGGRARPVVLLTFALVAGVLALIGWWSCGSQRSPAVPLVMATLETPFAWIVGVWLAVRALLGAGAATVRWAALAAAVAVLIGIFATFRREDMAEADTPRQIETLSAEQDPSETEIGDHPTA